MLILEEVPCPCALRMCTACSCSCDPYGVLRTGYVHIYVRATASSTQYLCLWPVPVPVQGQVQKMFFFKEKCACQLFGCFPDACSLSPVPAVMSCGQAAVIGPRPHQPGQAKLYRPSWRVLVCPGVNCFLPRASSRPFRHARPFESRRNTTPQLHKHHRHLT